MKFELTYFDANGNVKSSADSQGWIRREDTFTNKELKISFTVKQKNNILSILKTGIRESGSNRIHTMILNPGRICVHEGGGDLILPLGCGAICHCHSKDEAEVLIPLFNYWPSAGNLGVFGALTGNMVHSIILESGRLDTSLRLRTAYGSSKTYSLDPVFVFREYHDGSIPSDFSLVYDDFAGGLPELAARYRKYIMAKRGIPSLREKIQNNPTLEYSSKAIAVRFRMAVKQVNSMPEQTPDCHPPMSVYMTFDMVENIVKEFASQKIGPVEFNLVGWNNGGHDGSYPQLFPVEERLGGENAMRQLFETTQSYGYNMSLHDNYFDMYSIADSFSMEYANRNHDGTPTKGEVWGGGQAYQICARPAYEHYFRKNQELIKRFNLKGSYYIDVFSAAQLTPCHSPQHPMTREQNAFYWKKILGEAQATHGTVMSEGAREWSLPELDRAYSLTGSTLPAELTTTDNRRLALLDAEAPLYPLVCHGLLLYNTYRSGINRFPGDPLYLRNLAFGGIPLFYYHQFFIGDSWQREALSYASPETRSLQISRIKQASDDVKSLASLQIEFIERISFHTPSLIETVYENGTRVLTNQGKAAINFDSQTVIPPKSFIIRQNQ